LSQSPSSDTDLIKSIAASFLAHISNLFTYFLLCPLKHRLLAKKSENVTVGVADKQVGCYEVVDMISVLSIVGRVSVGGSGSSIAEGTWAIIDRVRSTRLRSFPPGDED
jgi:hypothetical protein